jgi:hypothetical protein
MNNSGKTQQITGVDESIHGMPLLISGNKTR